jgi:diaminopimelate decarboxylase
VAINKFGVGPDLAIKLVQKARRDPFLRIVGLAIHIGSQVADLEPYRAASQILAELARQLLAEGVPLEYLDVGGGLGIDYAKPAPEPISWVRAATAAVAETGLAVLCEPGRSIVGPAGVLLTSVVYAKKQGSKSYLIVDAGMTDLIRPALYDAFHPIWPVKKNQSRETGDGPSLVDVVGPVP